MTELLIEQISPSDEAGTPLGCCDYAFYDILDCMDEDDARIHDLH